MSLICVVLSCLCDGVCLFMCLWYGLYLLFVYRFHWFVLSVLFCYTLVFFLLCIGCLWCVVLLLVVSLVCRACMFCCRYVFDVFCYGLNDSPV